MTTAPASVNPLELQTGVLDSPTCRLTAHQHIGFELGWDYAHYRVTPPAPYAHEPSPLRNGLAAGEAAFGSRTLAATTHVRKWLQLRLHAWLRGRSVELVQVTPNYLQQIDVDHCPITRVALSSATLAATDASIDRVRNDAAYAAGNLAVLSTQANHAKGAHGRQAALRFAQQIEDGRLTGLGGLTAPQWARVAALCSFVEPVPHAQACALPLLVLPPNRLRLFNPVQALQAFVCRQWLAPGWSARLSRFEDLLPGKPLRRDFKTFVIALLPRIIEAASVERRAAPSRPTSSRGTTPQAPRGSHSGDERRAAPNRPVSPPRTAPDAPGGSRPESAPRTRWAIEDAWRSPLVQQRWARFAGQLDAARCEALLELAVSRRLCGTSVVTLSDAAALDGWMIDSRGYVPHATSAAARAVRERQQQLAW